MTSDAYWELVKQFPKKEGEPRNAYVRRLRKDHQLTFDQIGELVNLTRERVRQICKHQVFLYIAHNEQEVTSWARKIQLSYELLILPPSTDLKGLLCAAEFVGWQFWIDCTPEEIIATVDRGDVEFLNTRLRS